MAHPIWKVNSLRALFFILPFVFYISEDKIGSCCKRAATPLTHIPPWLPASLTVSLLAYFVLASAIPTPETQIDTPMSNWAINLPAGSRSPCAMFALCCSAVVSRTTAVAAAAAEDEPDDEDDDDSWPERATTSGRPIEETGAKNSNARQRRRRSSADGSCSGAARPTVPLWPLYRFDLSISP